MNYSMLTNRELIKYGLIDAPVGSLAALIATRFEDNMVSLDQIENDYAEALEALEENAREYKKTLANIKRRLK
jgi:hypothetical protein